MSFSAAIGAFGAATVLMGDVPEGEARAYETKFGGFQVALEGGRVTSMMGVDPLLEELQRLVKRPGLTCGSG